MDVPDSSLLFVALIILILFSAFFSATETAYSTCNKIRLKQMANRGNQRAENTLELCEKYDKLLSSILVGNNFVNITAATIATVAFTGIFSDKGATISTVVMTLTILLFGEITPKTLAKKFPDSFAMFAYPFLNFIVTILTPFTFLFHLWQKFINSFFKNTSNQGMTGEELITMIEEVEKEGSIEKEESELIQSAIEFSDVDIADIYTPRVNLVAVDIEDGYEEIEKAFKEHPYSRIPIYRDSIDNIIGFVHHRDFFLLENRDETSIEKILQEPVYLPLTTSLSDALKTMQKNKVHLAVVCDEYGGTAGIITLEDIIEELVGEIWDEHDEVVEEIIDLGNNSYQFEGTVSINEVFEIFDLYEEDIYDSNTVGGWVIEINEKMPEIGDIIEFKNLRIKVLDADDRKIKWVEITKVEEDNKNNTEEE